jgi:hypothetical protein
MKKSVILMSAIAMAVTGVAKAQENGALLDLLVKKRIISDQEAEEVRAELTKEYATSTSAGKLNLSSSLTELKLSGDLRMRYQYDNRDSQVDPAGIVDGPGDEDRSPSGTQRSRWRFRLRLNADFKLANNWFGGVQLQTSQASDSGNQTFENGFNNYSIFISRAYLGWNATDWMTIIAGKQANPFYTTDMVWDPDINPQGLVETIKFHKIYGSSSGDAGVGYSKDGKSYAGTESSAREERPWELTLNAGQFIFDDNAEGSFDNDEAIDAYLFVGQLVGSYSFNSKVKLTFAPGVMFFNAADLSGLINENAFTDVPGVSGETRKLVILTAPGDLTLKLGSKPAKFYWDFAYNTQGKGRADDIYGLFGFDPTTATVQSLHKSEDDFAWLVGLQLGENKKKGDWSLLANYRQTGIAAVDPNLNDSDFALGELNTRGFKTSLFYNFTDFCSAGVSYYYAWNLRDNLFGGQATGGAGIADSNVIQVLQVDLNVKF